MKISNHFNSKSSLIIPEENFGVEIIPLTSKAKRKYNVKYIYNLIGMSVGLYLFSSGNFFMAEGKEDELSFQGFLPIFISALIGLVLICGSLLKTLVDLINRPDEHAKAIVEMMSKREEWETESLIPYLNETYGIEILSLNLDEEEGESNGIARKVYNDNSHDLIQGSSSVKFPLHIEGITYTQDDRFPFAYPGAKPYRVKVDMDNLKVLMPKPQVPVVLEKS